MPNTLLEDVFLQFLVIFSLTLDTLAADLEVMMVGAGLGDDQGAQADGGELVGVVGHVNVAVPDDHHDGGLKCELPAGFGVYVDYDILAF